MAYNISNIGGAATNSNFSIYIGTTASTSLSAFTTTGLSLVYGPSTYTHSVGVNTINFATPFVWDGVSNIIIDIRQDGNASALNAQSYYTATAGNTTVYSYSSTPSSTTILANSSPLAYTSTQRLNIILGYAAKCFSVRSTVTANVTPAPTVIASGTNTVCSGSATPISATSTNAGYNYTWTPGSLVGASQNVAPAITTIYTVTALDATTGTNAGCINTATVQITANLAAPNITTSVHDTAICIGNIVPITATYAGVSGNVAVGTGTTTNAASAYPAPYSVYNGGAKHQMLIRANELTALGLIPGSKINTVGFNVSSIGAVSSLTSFQIDMGSTLDTVITTGYFFSGLTTVYGPQTQSIVVGANTHTLTTPYIWDGSSNLVIQTSFSNGSATVLANAIIMTNTATAYASTGFFKASGFTSAFILSIAAPTTVVNIRPNIALGIAKPVITWNPISKLYTDAACTSPYISGDSTKLYAKPIANTTYTVSTIYGSCNKMDTTKITVNSLPTVTASAPVIACKGGGATITAIGANGTTPYQYNLNSNSFQTIDSFTSNLANTYTVNIKDANACTASTTVIVTEPTTALSASATKSNVLCNGATSGTITPIANGGTGAYTYLINGLPIVSNYNANTYTIQVTDAKNCKATTTVTLTEPTAISVTHSKIDATCNGANGTLNFAATGGTGAITFTVNGVTHTSPYSVLAGNYTIVATDNNLCSVTILDTINESSALVSTVGFTSPICNGGNGSLTFSTTGGTGTITYKVNNVIQSSPYTTPAGVYTVLSTDALGCTAIKLDTITEPTPVSLTVSPSSILCYGGNSTITLSQSGGTGLFKDSANGAVFANPYLAGNYTISATDANGCSKSTTLSISQPTAVSLSASASSILCNGGNSTITLTQSGGTGLFKDSANGAVFANPYLAGSYTISATDANGCSKTTTLSISEPTAVTLSASPSTILCNGGNSTITLTQSGGTGTLADTTNGALFTNPYLSGSYTISATDANGCSKTTTVSISQPTAVNLSVSASSILCNGGNSTITLTQSGGTGTLADTTNGAVFSNPYPAGSYTISATDANGCRKTTTVSISQPTAVNLSVSASSILCNGGNSTITLTQSGGTGTLADTTNGAVFANPYLAGSYTISATDANGCSKTTTLSISQPTAVTLSASASAILCNGGTSTITLTQAGGTGAYIDSANGAVFANPYAAGTYTIKASDANGCTATTSVTISQPTAVTLSASASAILCNGGTSTIILTQSGGTAPLADSVNGAVFASPYVAGTYTIKATDANGCTATTSVTISQPTAVTLSANASAILCNGGTSTITLTQAGGTGSYADSVNGAVFANPYAAGTYIIKATDAHGCTATTSVTISQPTAVTLSASASAILCNGGTSTITLTQAGGTGAYIDSANGAVFANPYAAGTYTIKATDANSCFTSTTVTLTNPAAIAISANATSTSICKTTTTLLTATGTGLTYTWMPGAATGANDTIMPAATTIYTVTGTDGVCSNTATVQVVVNTTSGDLSQATSTNMLSTAGSSCNTSLQPNGSTVSYFDNNCDLIATVQDASGGNTLGSVTSCVTVDPTVQNVNGQPYLPRHYTITPTTSGPANVTLYYTQDDFDNYNANNGSLPDLPTTGGSTVSMCIYQYTKMLNAPGSTFEAMIPVTLTWDAVGHHWTVTFPVTGFSEFYCAACNPTASPLNVDVVDFAGRKDGNTSLLTWTTLHETNNANFVVKRGTSTLDINTTLGTVKTLAANGTSSSALSYSYVDEKPNNGHNYYQLQQVDIDGKVNTVNKIVDVYYTDGATVTIYPNPTQDDLHVDINIDRATQATIKIMDVAGKTIKTIETDLTKGINKTNVKLSELVPGTYLLKVIDGKGLNYSQQFRKM